MRLDDFGKTFSGFFDVGAAVEGAQTEIALPAGSKPASWCSHYVGFPQQLVEEIPTAQAAGNLQPQIRRIHAAVGLYSQLLQRFTQQPGVGEINLYGCPNLLPAFRRVNCLRASLNGIRDPIKLGA